MSYMKIIAHDLVEQVRVSWKYFLIYFYFPVFIVLFAAFVFTKNNPGLNPEILFRDITALAELPFYTGFISQLGSLLWAASVMACFLALFFLKKLHIGSSQTRQFLLQAGLFSAFLMLDDVFLFHEEIAIEYFSMGQKKVYLAYFLVILAFLYFNRREILSSDYLFFIIAMMMFGSSIALDVVADNFFEGIEEQIPLYETYEVFLEDGLKFLGIATWLAFYLGYIYNIFTPLFKRAEAEQAG